ncbi:MAG: ABC transporter permease [Bacteroidales bacterium]|nr:ABC transporter permease [Bacteroidales bacterium]
MNTFKIAFRKLLKHRFYTFINVTGLAIAFSSLIIIGLYVVDEMKFDRYHSKAQRIYRISQISDFDGVFERSSSAPIPLGPNLQKDYKDQIEDVVRLFNFQTKQLLIQHDFDNFDESHAFFTDSNIFKVFDFEFISGNPEDALMTPHSVVLSQTAAAKYFGDEYPIGDTLKLMNSQHMIVKGVYKDLPEQTHFKADVLIPMSLLPKMMGKKMMQGWVWNPCWTYVLLKEGVSAAELEKEFPEFIKKHFHEGEHLRQSLHLQPMVRIHLHSNLDFEIEPNSDVTYILILSGIAFFLLALAIINFINLSTAISSVREREIGIKKVIGADRRDIIMQFIAEALIISLSAFAISLVLVELFLPYFNALSGKEFNLYSIILLRTLIPLLILVMAVGILSGLYPAIRFSKLDPVPALRSAMVHSLRKSKGRKILVVIQFAISISLIIVTIISLDQVRYLNKADLGFNKKDVIILPISFTRISKYYDAFKMGALEHPGVKSVTAMDYIIGTDHNNHEYSPEGLDTSKLYFFPTLIVREDFVSTFEIELLAGRDFIKDTTRKIQNNDLLINESMVQHMGWESNEAALGKSFSTFKGDEKIIGVFKDFHIKSLRSPKRPFVLEMKDHPYEIENYTRWVAIRIDPNQLDPIIDHLKKVWNSYALYRSFQFTFLEEELDNMYTDEKTLSAYSLIFSIINIFIAGIGLLGLTSYLTDQRTKEIGIRKMLGASVFGIVKQLSKDYILLILLANSIAWPLTYLTLHYWLQTYSYHTEINLWYFACAAIIAISLAMLIIGYRAIRAAFASPSQTLKYE